MFRNVTVTAIGAPFTVHNAKGKVYAQSCRSSFGLSFCISGQITYTMDGKEFVSVPGTAVLLPKGGCYTLRGDKEGLFPLINFECVGLEATEIRVLPLTDPLACISDFRRLAAAFANEEDRLQGFSIFYGLLQRLTHEQHPEDLRLSPALEYIRGHLTDPGLTNQALADHLGISEVYLRKLFLSRYSTTPKQYILKQRLNMAQQLLLDTALSVTQIAERCGFTSVYHFCRAFKDKTGISPSQYGKETRLSQL